LVAQQIDLALRRKDFTKAIELAEKFISQQPKAKLTPGMPAQYAGYAALQSPRTFMLCKLAMCTGTWAERQGLRHLQADHRREIDQTKTAYATICMVRGRTKETSEIIEAALAAQEVKPPMLLQMRAEIAALDGKPEVAFDAIARLRSTRPLMRTIRRARRGLGADPVQPRAAVRADRQVRCLVREKIKKNPLDWDSYSNLAESYCRRRPAEALAVLDEADKQPALAGRFSICACSGCATPPLSTS